MPPWRACGPRRRGGDCHCVETVQVGGHFKQRFFGPLECIGIFPLKKMHRCDSTHRRRFPRIDPI